MTRISSLSVLLFALSNLANAGHSDLLSPDEAFQIVARSMPDATIEVEFSAAPSYVLYQDKLAFRSNNPNIKLVNIVLPRPFIKYDHVIEKDVAYYMGKTTVLLKPDNATTPFTLSVLAQGCATGQGVCYPPMIKSFQIPALQK